MKHLTNNVMNAVNLLQFFKYDHLPERLANVSKPFCEVAHKMKIGADLRQEFIELEKVIKGLPDSETNFESQWAQKKLILASSAFFDDRVYNGTAKKPSAIRLLLEAKDCAVRAVVSQ